MKKHTLWTITAMAATLILTGCGHGHEEKHADVHPATVEASGDSGISRITLTERAAERLGIRLARVEAAGNGLLAAPYGALLYDASGGEWVYTSPQPRVFERAPVEVARIEGERIYLSEGPAVGARVVFVGAAELFGAEFEIGH